MITYNPYHESVSRIEAAKLRVGNGTSGTTSTVRVLSLLLSILKKKDLTVLLQ